MLKLVSLTTVQHCVILSLITMVLAACGGSSSNNSAGSGINSAPTLANFSATTNGLVATFTWTASDPDNDALTCTLEPDGELETIRLSGADCTSGNQVVTYSFGRTNSATLTISDTDSATATATIPVTVAAASSNTSPTISSFTNTANNLDVTFNWSVADADSDTLSCTISFGDSTANATVADCANTTSTTHSYSAGGSYTISLTVSDGSGSTTQGDSVTVVAPAAVSGSVSTFPETSSNSSSIRRFIPQENSASGQFFSNVTSGSDPVDCSDTSALTALPRECMVPTNALISLYLLADINFSNAIATVPSADDGSYEVTADDVRDYLIANSSGAITASSSVDEVITAFRALGQLQVRALILSSDGSEPLAIQSITNPSNLDENGDPVESPIDPIVNQTAQSLMQTIEKTINNLQSDIGVDPTKAVDLAAQVINNLGDDIEKLIDQAKNNVIQIPEGQTINEVIAQSESQIELNDDGSLAATLNGVFTQSTQLDINTLETQVGASENEVSDEDSTLNASLDSDSQGLLSSLEAALNEQASADVEEILNGESQADLAALFGLENTNSSAAESALAAAALQNAELRRTTLQRFFLNMGFAVVVDKNNKSSADTAATASVVAVNLPSPPFITNALLPGSRGFQDRGVRLVKIGSGALDSGSKYTSNADYAPGGSRAAELAKLQDGCSDVGQKVTINDVEVTCKRQKPWFYVPALSSVPATLLAGNSNGTFDDSAALSAAVDAAFGRIISPSADPTSADFELVDRIRVYHEFSQRIEEANIVSFATIETLLENREATVQLKRLSAVVAENFSWVNESVNLTPQGFPIFTGREVPLSGGANTVDSSEVVRALSLTLAATPIETTQLLTSRVSFYAQFAAEAIQQGIQREKFAAGVDGTVFDPIAALLRIYPTDKANYETLVLGDATAGLQATPGYNVARDKTARGITSLPSALFGKTLNSESSMSLRSAFFFMDFMTKSSFLIDTSDGFFTAFDLDDANDANENSATTETVQVPNFDNIKVLRAADSVTVGSIASQLLNITAVNNGSFFASIKTSLAAGLTALPDLPEFKEQNLDDFQDDSGDSLLAAASSVNLSCAIERFDGTDPNAGSNPLEFSVFQVQYDQETGEYFKGDAITIAEDSSATLQLNKGSFENGRRNYSISGWTEASSEAGYNSDYVVRLKIPGRQNELPELYFFVDGFTDTLQLCDSEYPLFIGSDQKFVPIPGLGMISDQTRPNSSDSTQPEQAEGIDISNYTKPGGLVFLTEDEVDRGQGTVDFVFETNDDDSVSINAVDSAVGFAPIFGGYDNGALSLTLFPAEGDERMSDNYSIVGQSIRTLAAQALFGADATPNTSDDSVLPMQPSLAIAESFITESDAPPSSDIERNQLYLMRDAGGSFWVIELRFAERFTEADGSSSVFIDFGFVTMNSIGNVVIPESKFSETATTADSATGNSEPSAGGSDENTVPDIRSGLQFYSLLYGDHLVLNRPGTPGEAGFYQGPELLPPVEVNLFSGAPEYAELAAATDGVIIRYAAEHFEDNISGPEDFESVFGNPPNFSDIPVRLDAGREGISFVKLGFNKTSRSYTLSPAPESRISYISGLKHNDIVAIFESSAEADADAAPSFMARVVRSLPSDDPNANFQLDLDIIQFDPENSTRETDNVVCFTEAESSVGAADGEDCVLTVSESAVSLPSLNNAAGTAIGKIYDLDFDGVPALFDPNDNDPNIPGSPASSSAGSTSGGSSSNGLSELEVVILTESDGSGGREQSFLINSRDVYPGEIKKVFVTSPQLFGDNIVDLFGCNLPRLNQGTGEFIDYSCNVTTVAATNHVLISNSALPAGSTLTADGSSDAEAGFALSVPDCALLDPSKLTAPLTDTGNALAGLALTEGQTACDLTLTEDQIAAWPRFQRVDFNFDMSFNKPQDENGNPFQCGTAECPARPAVSGKVTVQLSGSAPILTDVKVALGSNNPTSLSGLASLDVSRDISFTGAPVTGAAQYELEVYCPEVDTQDNYFPEESFFWHAPGSNSQGNPVGPNFNVGLQQLGGRTCTVELVAVLENSAGDFTGISRVQFPNLSTTGTNSGGGAFVDNEIKVELNDVLCLVDDESGTRVVKEPLSAPSLCDTSNMIFQLTDLPVNGAADETAQVQLSGGVSKAGADGGRLTLTEGALSTAGSGAIENGIQIAVNLGQAEDGVDCGAIENDTFSNTCAGLAFSELAPVFVVTDGALTFDASTTFDSDGEYVADGSGSLTMADLFTLAGPTNDDGNIPLDAAGFYEMLDSDGEPVLELSIDTFTFENVTEVYVRMTIVDGNVTYDAADSTSSLNFSLSSPGRLYAQLTGNNQQVEFDVLRIRPQQMKVAWFLPPQQITLAGSHDLDEDGNNDVTVVQDGDNWTFTFDASFVQSGQRFGPTGPIELDTNESGNPSFTFDASGTESFVAMTLYFVNGEQWQFEAIYPHSGGEEPFAFWFEVFGGCGAEGCGGPAELFSFELAEGQTTTLYFSNEEWFGASGASDDSNNDKREAVLAITTGTSAYSVVVDSGKPGLTIGYETADGGFEEGSQGSIPRVNDQPSNVLVFPNGNGLGDWRIELDTMDDGTVTAKVLFEALGGGAAGNGGNPLFLVEEAAQAGRFESGNAFANVIYGAQAGDFSFEVTVRDFDPQDSLQTITLMSGIVSEDGIVDPDLSSTPIATVMGNASSWTEQTDGSWLVKGEAPLTATQLEKIEAQTNGVFLVVHSATFPASSDQALVFAHLYLGGGCGDNCGPPSLFSSTIELNQNGSLYFGAKGISDNSSDNGLLVLTMNPTADGIAIELPSVGNLEVFYINDNGNSESITTSGTVPFEFNSGHAFFELSAPDAGIGFSIGFVPDDEDNPALYTYDVYPGGGICFDCGGPGGAGGAAPLFELSIPADASTNLLHIRFNENGVPEFVSADTAGAQLVMTFSADSSSNTVQVAVGDAFTGVQIGYEDATGQPQSDTSATVSYDPSFGTFFSVFGGDPEINWAVEVQPEEGNLIGISIFENTSAGFTFDFGLLDGSEFQVVFEFDDNGTPTAGAETFAFSGSSFTIYDGVVTNTDSANPVDSGTYNILDGVVELTYSNQEQEYISIFEFGGSWFSTCWGESINEAFDCKPDELEYFFFSSSEAEIYLNDGGPTNGPPTVHGQGGDGSGDGSGDGNGDGSGDGNGDGSGDGDGDGNSDGGFTTEPDADFDGTPDDRDAFPQDFNESKDSDNDGIGDNEDACPFITNQDDSVDTDSDTIPDACDLTDSLTDISGLYLFVATLGSSSQGCTTDSSSSLVVEGELQYLQQTGADVRITGHDNESGYPWTSHATLVDTQNGSSTISLMSTYVDEDEDSQSTTTEITDMAYDSFTGSFSGTLTETEQVENSVGDLEIVCEQLWTVEYQPTEPVADNGAVAENGFTWTDRSSDYNVSTQTHEVELKYATTIWDASAGTTDFDAFYFDDQIPAFVAQDNSEPEYLWLGANGWELASDVFSVVEVDISGNLIIEINNGASTSYMSQSAEFESIDLSSRPQSVMSPAGWADALFDETTAYSSGASLLLASVEVTSAGFSIDCDGPDLLASLNLDCENALTLSAAGDDGIAVVETLDDLLVQDTVVRTLFSYRNLNLMAEVIGSTVSDGAAGSMNLYVDDSSGSQPNLVNTIDYQVISVEGEVLLTFTLPDNVAMAFKVDAEERNAFFVAYAEPTDGSEIVRQGTHYPVGAQYEHYPQLNSIALSDLLSNLDNNALANATAADSDQCSNDVITGGFGSELGSESTGASQNENDDTGSANSIGSTDDQCGGFSDGNGSDGGESTAGDFGDGDADGNDGEGFTDGGDGGSSV